MIFTHSIVSLPIICKVFFLFFILVTEMHWKAQDSFLTSLWDLLSNKQVQFPNTSTRTRATECYAFCSAALIIRRQLKI